MTFVFQIQFIESESLFKYNFAFLLYKYIDLTTFIFGKNNMCNFGCHNFKRIIIEIVM